MFDRPPMTLGEAFYRTMRMVVLLLGYTVTILGVVMVLISVLR